MTEETERSQRWGFYLAGSGILAILLELTLAIVFLEQVFSHAPMSFHRATSILTVLSSLIVTPLPWFVIRMRCQSLREVMLGLGADENAMSSVDETLGGLLILIYVALISCAVPLARLT